MNDDASASPDSAPGLDLPAPPQAGGYRVLARKYRPSTFDDLIGQDVMVRTLRNAFAQNRIPQAWMLTGVRGVGKTTTARILARGLNYELPDNKNAGPTIDLTTPGVHCTDIIEGRHVDVFEIDAASNTGVDNIRQINDAVRYAPALARYKVYIVDEVHMLSTGAFNAFLKTLEEPPPHVKFIFATTEIRKVPVTILSRCQRVDLKRIDAAELAAHLKKIADAEKISIDDEALASLARAAEGSARDSLSLLDQAIAHGAGHVTGETVRAMLGLADRGRIMDLFETAMRGDLATALGQLRDLWNGGADPASVIADLADFTHLVTRIKIVPSSAKEASLAPEERTRGSDYAERLSIRILSRAWTLLTKSLVDVQTSPKPLAAAEMALVRFVHAADLPTPDEALRALRDGGGPDSGNAGPSGAGGSGSGGTGGGARAALSPVPRPVMAATGSDGGARMQPRPAAAPDTAPRAMIAQPQSLQDIVALADKHRDLRLKADIERDIHLVAFEQGRIICRLGERASRTLPNDLSRALQEWTGARWVVALSNDEGAPTLRAQKAEAEQANRSSAAQYPVVRALLDAMPGAEIVAVRDIAPEPYADPAPLPAAAINTETGDLEYLPVDDYTDDDL
ncbi:MAG: DNA polymerase III subunit gamma/tau [Beijerinckiaceae bacterium]